MPRDLARRRSGLVGHSTANVVRALAVLELPSAPAELGRGRGGGQHKFVLNANWKLYVWSVRTRERACSRLARWLVSPAGASSAAGAPAAAAGGVAIAHGGGGGGAPAANESDGTMELLLVDSGQNAAGGGGGGAEMATPGRRPLR